MEIIISLFSFAFIASFTPGPNNILVMSQGINKGLRSTFPYQAGAGVACFVIIFAAILLGAQLEKLIPAIIPVMKYVGCAYMLYLAFVVATSKPVTVDGTLRQTTFVQGFLLQFVNPKYYLYVLTLAAVIIPFARDMLLIVGYSFFFSVLAVVGMFAWAMSGALLQHFLQKHYKIVNGIMGLALVYCSFSLFF